MVVLIAGVLQFTAWKARHLACCRETPTPDRAVSLSAYTAWRRGLHLGVHRTLCCAASRKRFRLFRYAPRGSFDERGCTHRLMSAGSDRLSGTARDESQGPPVK